MSLQTWGDREQQNLGADPLCIFVLWTLHWTSAPDLIWMKYHIWGWSLSLKPSLCLFDSLGFTFLFCCEWPRALISGGQHKPLLWCDTHRGTLGSGETRGFFFCGKVRRQTGKLQNSLSPLTWWETGNSHGYFPSKENAPVGTWLLYICFQFYLQSLLFL